MAKSYTPSFHAKLTKQIVEQFDLENGRRNVIMNKGSEMGFKLNVNPQKNPLVPFIQKAKTKAKHCQCGKLACAWCGFLAFHARVHRVSKTAINGYLTGGAM